MTSRRERFSNLLWSLLALAIVVGGVAGFVVLGALRTPLVAVEIERVVPLVETASLTLHEAPITVRGEGFVKPRRQVTIAAEAPGRIVELHPALLELGSVSEGETLVRLDDRAARATLARAEADIEATRARLELNRTQLARTETLRRRGVVSQDELDQGLALEAELEGTLSSVQSARLGAEIALENTRVQAPFDGAVLSRSAELGGVVGVGQAIAELFTPDALEVTVPLVERAAALVPGLFEEGAAKATVTTSFAGLEAERPARVARVASVLGAATRMLDVTVALEPEGARAIGEAPASGLPPALVDGYARVAIEGERREGVYALPSSAVRPGGVVWLAVEEIFTVRPARTVHVDGATSYVRIESLPAEAVLVIGIVDTPVDGMRVRRRSVATEDDPETGFEAVSDVGAGAPGRGRAALRATTLDD